MFVDRPDSHKTWKLRQFCMISIRHKIIFEIFVADRGILSPLGEFLKRNGRVKRLLPVSWKYLTGDSFERAGGMGFSIVEGRSEVRMHGYAPGRYSRLSRPHSLATNNHLLVGDTSPLHMIGVLPWCRSFFPSFSNCGP